MTATTATTAMPARRRTARRLAATATTALALGWGGAAAAQAAGTGFDETHRNDKGSNSRTFHLDDGRMTGNLRFTCNDGSVVVSLWHEFWTGDVKAGGSETVSCDGRFHALDWDHVNGGDYHFHFDPVNAEGANPLRVVGDVNQ